MIWAAKDGSEAGHIFAAEHILYAHFTDKVNPLHLVL